MYIIKCHSYKTIICIRKFIVLKYLNKSRDLVYSGEILQLIKSDPRVGLQRKSNRRCGNNVGLIS